MIAQSYARIFYRNAINIGLPILESYEAVEKIEPGNEIEIDLNCGRIFNKTKSETYQATIFPEFMQKLIAAGGLMAWIRQERVK